MADDEFDAMMTTGLAQAEAGESYPVDVTFEELRMSNTKNASVNAGM